MIKYYCDKCGKEIKDVKGDTVSTAWSMVNGAIKTYVLCKECNIKYIQMESRVHALFFKSK